MTDFVLANFRFKVFKQVKIIIPASRFMLRVKNTKIQTLGKGGKYVQS